MNARVEKIDKGEAFLEIEVSADKLEEGMEHAYRTVVKQVTVPGFRKGKVPRQLLEAYYGKEVLFQDALEHVIPGIYDQAVNELELKVMGQPEFDFDIEALEEGKPFMVKAAVAVEPEVVMGEIEGIEIQVPDFVVSDEMVENRLNDMRSSYAQMVEKNEASELGDTVTINFEGFIDGVPFDGGKGEDYQLALGSNTFIPGFEEQLSGLKAGEQKDVQVSFPEDYQAEELAGQPAVFKVEVKSVQTKQMRELNDEFVQEVSECETVAELRDDIRKTLTEMGEANRRDTLRQAAVEKALEKCQVDLAESAIRSQAGVMTQQLEQRLMSQGIALEQYLTITNSSIEVLINSLMPEAEKQLKTNFVLEKLIDEKGIEINDEELDIYINDMAEKMGMEVEEVRKNIEGMIENIRYNLKMDKAVDYLVEHAVISTEVPAAVEADAGENENPTEETKAEE
ncbi:cell division trigger factor [hydrocarbon metagenome]|uniref:peptidylprolyl isomerase n=1 Tax=hydrocarbon metagenome TaxID=938273 RepID=A0A0W8E3A7_9ZZZZ